MSGVWCWKGNNVTLPAVTSPGHNRRIVISTALLLGAGFLINLGILNATSVWSSFHQFVPPGDWSFDGVPTGEFLIWAGTPKRGVLSRWDLVGIERPTTATADMTPMHLSSEQLAAAAQALGRAEPWESEAECTAYLRQWAEGANVVAVSNNRGFPLYCEEKRWHTQGDLGNAMIKLFDGDGAWFSFTSDSRTRWWPLLFNTVFWAGATGLIVMGLTAGLARVQSSSRRRRGCCPGCAYDLKGDQAGGCPECGWRRAGREL